MAADFTAPRARPQSRRSAVVDCGIRLWTCDVPTRHESSRVGTASRKLQSQWKIYPSLLCPPVTHKASWSSPGSGRSGWLVKPAHRGNAVNQFPKGQRAGVRLRPIRFDEARLTDNSCPSKRTGRGTEALCVDARRQFNQRPHVVGGSRSGFEQYSQQGALRPANHNFAVSREQVESVGLEPFAFATEGGHLAALRSTGRQPSAIQRSISSKSHRTNEASRSGDGMRPASASL